MVDAGLPDLLERVEALETRVDLLEDRQQTAIAGAQREFDAAKETRQRDRWLATLRRR